MATVHWKFTNSTEKLDFNFNLNTHMGVGSTEQNIASLFHFTLVATMEFDLLSHPDSPKRLKAEK